MKILVSGGTGFIGSKLCEYFVKSGHQVDILTRNIHPKKTMPSPIQLKTDLKNRADRYDVIINLSGEPLNKHRWNKDVKKTILESRLQSTQKIIDYINECHVKPKLLISGSAIGFYGHSLDQIFTENSLPATKEFIHDLCREWEEVAMKAENHGVRVCLLRTGIVLDKKNGALAEMLYPFKLGLGAQLGAGDQWMSWIHIDDVVGAIDFLIQHKDLEGAFNLTSLGTVSNKDFTIELAKALNRPSWITLPSFVVKFLFGEMGEALLLNGQRVIPEKLLKAGYSFKFQTLDKALKNILG